MKLLAKVFPFLISTRGKCAFLGKKSELGEDELDETDQLIPCPFTNHFHLCTVGIVRSIQWDTYLLTYQNGSRSRRHWITRTSSDDPVDKSSIM